MHSEEIKAKATEIVQDLKEFVELLGDEDGVRMYFVGFAEAVQEYFLDETPPVSMLLPFVCETEAALPPRAMMLTPEQMESLHMRMMSKALTGIEPEGEVECEQLYVYDKHSGNWLLGTAAAEPQLNSLLTERAQNLGVDLDAP